MAAVEPLRRFRPWGTSHRDAALRYPPPGMSERLASPHAGVERKRDQLEVVELCLILVARAAAILLGTALIVLAAVLLFSDGFEVSAALRSLGTSGVGGALLRFGGRPPTPSR